jgi:DNA-binding NarL/FixJ family response regulator
MSSWRDAAARPLRVLVIQRQAVISEELQERLARGGMNVVAAVDTARAAIETNRLRPDVILMDIRPSSGERGVDSAIDFLRQVDVRELETRAARALAAARRLYATLSAREREVFGRVVQGKLNKQIANDLHITERTVKAHRAQVMRKMNVHSLAELTRLAEHLGI